MCEVGDVGGIAYAQAQEPTLAAAVFLGHA
jgi:hypothetical protein